MKLKEDASVGKNKSVFGMYSTRPEAESALNALRDAGFASSDISVLLPENLPATEERQVIADHGTKAPEGAAVGIGSGAAIGGTLGWLVGVGALAIPGIGPIIAAGPIVSTLAGIGVGCAFGGFAGVLVGVGIPENEAEKYEKRILTGEILVAIRCGTLQEMQCATELLEMTNAEDINSSGEASTHRKRAA